jgi:hypothetical protein
MQTRPFASGRKRQFAFENIKGANARCMLGIDPTRGFECRPSQDKSLPFDQCRTQFEAVISVPFCLRAQPIERVRLVETAVCNGCGNLPPAAVTSARHLSSRTVGCPPRPILGPKTAVAEPENCACKSGEENDSGDRQASQLLHPGTRHHDRHCNAKTLHRARTTVVPDASQEKIVRNFAALSERVLAFCRVTGAERVRRAARKIVAMFLLASVVVRAFPEEPLPPDPVSWFVSPPALPSQGPTHFCNSKKPQGQT